MRPEIWQRSANNLLFKPIILRNCKLEMMKIRGMLSAVTLIALALGLVAWTQKPERKAGDLVDGRVLLPTEQLAGGAGTRFTVIGRPVDLVTSADTTVYLKTADAVWKLENGKPTRSAPLAGASLHGLAITPDGTKLLATDAGNGLHIYTTNGMKEEQVIRLPSAAIGGSSYPCGLGVTPDGKSAWVCLSRSNLIVMVDLTTGKIIHQIPVEPAPYDVALLGDHAVVTCWGRTPTPHSNSALSSGTSVSIDDRGISSGGSLCFVDLKSKVVKKLSVPRQPSEILVVNPQLAYVPCAADDQLLALNPSTQLVLKTIPIRMRDTERGGVAPNALCISPDKSRLYLACGGINALAVIDLLGARERITGFIPTDWYPIAVTATQNSLLVANAKGLGSRSGQGNKRGVYDFL